MRTTRINTFIAKDGMANELHEFLVSVIAIITQSPGCESCHVLRRQDNAHELVIIETWTSVAAHQTAAKAIPPEKIAMVMPLLSQPPSGAYYMA